MKKLMFLMMALLVAPAMATITVEIVDNGDCTADIVISADGDDADGFGSLLGGIAFDASVDGGAQMLSVSNYHTGESTAQDGRYGIYLGSITFAVVDDETVIDDAGSPVSRGGPDGDPDDPPQLPGPACTLEFAAVYPVSTPDAAPDATTTLCTIEVDQGTTLTLVLDDTRGQAVNIAGGAPSEVVFVGGAIADCGEGCWTNSCQPFGDANGDGLISAQDVQLLVGCWGGSYDPCCDFNRDGIVSAQDVQILVASWGNPCP